MYLKPNPDRKVLLRDPKSHVQLPTYGANVSNSKYWVRRLAEKDALQTTHAEIVSGRAEAKKLHDAQVAEVAKKANAKEDAKAKAKADDEAKAAKADKAAKAKADKAAADKAAASDK